MSSILILSQTSLGVVRWRKQTECQIWIWNANNYSEKYQKIWDILRLMIKTERGMKICDTISYTNLLNK